MDIEGIPAYLSDSEKLFIRRIMRICKDLPYTTHNDFSLGEWTYKKLCVPKFSTEHKLWLLEQHVEYVRNHVKDYGENEVLAGVISDLIEYCLAWMYILIDWEKVENEDMLVE